MKLLITKNISQFFQRAGVWQAFVVLLYLVIAPYCVFAQNSVLATGTWYKIGITQTGIYKLDQDFFKSIGINTNQLNPKNLRLYGNGGQILPQPNTASRYQDLVENAILVNGEADGKFDVGDALYFFGESPHTIKYNSAENRMYHELNLYSDTTFYFLQISDKEGLRIKSKVAGKSGLIVDKYDEYVFRESELTNRVSSGRGWWGEYFGSQNRQDFSYDIPGVVVGPTKITMATVATAQVETKFSVALNGQSVGNQTMPTVSTFRYDTKGQTVQKTYSTDIATSTNKLNISINFDKAGQASAEGYLDFFGVQFQRNLQVYDKLIVFQNIATTAQDSARFQIEQATPKTQIWDITNALSPIVQQYMLTANTATFGTDTKLLRKFILFSDEQILKPATTRRIANQNLRSLATPNLLIITPSIWLKQAQRLASFRQQNDGMSVQVVLIEQIYNEFSSGKLDPTAIRDFVRYIYKKQPDQLKYLLLFGDASFDFKNNVKAFSNKELSNFIPTYESRESAHPVLSYSSDDYFGFLEDNEGNWQEDYDGNHTLDIGIGRLPVKTIEEATAAVDKLVNYNTTQTRGRWRQRIAFVADDGDTNLHQEDAEDLADIVSRKDTTYQLNKIYIDAFTQYTTPFQRAPQVNEAIRRTINEGVLMLNYTGHGGISVWSDEQIVNLDELFKWRSIKNMPLVITATCEFGRYDNPAEMSGAEIAVLNPRGGAIAMLTTARPVYANTNFLLNQAFYEAVFKPIDGQMPRLGDIIRITKNNSLSGVFNRNFTLLGDPSLRLNYPDYQVNITTVDTLKSGKIAQLAGEILDKKQLKTDFDGEAFITIYDKISTLKTLGSEDPAMAYKIYDKKIYEGLVSVKKGKFKLSFVVSKLEKSTFDVGRVQAYAISSDSLADAAGANNKILIGGSVAAPADTKPPTIQLYIDDENFKSGGEAMPNSLLIAKLFDENGFNLRKPVVLTLNDTLTIELNNYLEASKDDYKNAFIRFPFQNLPTGSYTVKLKMFDSYNNVAEASLDFIVEPQVHLIKSAKVFPNPAVENSTIQLELYGEGDDIEVAVQIFDILGKQIISHKTQYYNANLIQNILKWDGKGTESQRVDSGEYFYKIIVTSLTKNNKQQVGGKLIRLK